jgi:hypothetical protein
MTVMARETHNSGISQPGTMLFNVLQRHFSQILSDGSGVPMSSKISAIRVNACLKYC